MDHHIGVIAELGAQGLELVCRLAKVSVGHYDYFHPAWDTFPDEFRNALSMRPMPHMQRGTIAINSEKTRIFNPARLQRMGAVYTPEGHEGQ
jgi:hypothetical protein